MIKRRKKGGGRKLLANKGRTKSGRIKAAEQEPREISRIKDQALESRLAVETGTWRRRKQAEADGEIITVEEARLPDRGTVIDAWLKASNDARARGKPENAIVSDDQVSALKAYVELHHAYLSVIGARGVRSASDFGGTGGYDNSDPFCSDAAQRDKRTVAQYKACRRAILEAGSFAMSAVEAIMIHDRNIPALIGDLRSAANALDRLRIMRIAA